MLDLPFGGCTPSPDPDAGADDGGAERVRHTLLGPGGGVEIWADPVFSWVQVFTSAAFPGRDRVVAVEPSTCPPNALRTGTDLIALVRKYAPGTVVAVEYRRGSKTQSASVTLVADAN